MEKQFIIASIIGLGFLVLSGKEVLFLILQLRFI